MTAYDASGQELTYGPPSTPPETSSSPEPPRGPSAEPEPSAELAPVSQTDSVVLSNEQLRTGTEWVESGRLRLRRRIVSETRTVQVVVRREELIIETVDAAAPNGRSYVGTALDGPPATAPTSARSTPFVALLREEVPVVTLRPRVYERVTAEIAIVNDSVILHHTVRSERVGPETGRVEH